MMSLVNPTVIAPSTKGEGSPDVPVKTSVPANKRKPGILKMLRYGGLSLLIIYGAGVVITHFAYSADDRSACYDAGGTSGLLFCPDWVEIEGYHIHLVNALVWPLDMVGARTKKIEKIEKPSTFVRHSPGAEFTKEREQTLQASISEAQRLLNDLGFKVGVPDGVIGQHTYAAINDFQLQDGMQMSGLVTDELIARLKNRVQASQSKEAAQR